MFLGNPIHDKPYSHFVQSVRSKTVDVVTVKENHIQYNIGEHKFQVVRPRGETGSVKELKENGISFSVEEKSIDILFSSYQLYVSEILKLRIIQPGQW